MKKNSYIILALAGMLSMNSCNDDEFLPGNPSMEIKAENADALFGDSLPFTIKASDVDVPLSTLKAQLFYGEEQVSETVIRTKTSGNDYTGKIFVPYYSLKDSLSSSYPRQMPEIYINAAPVRGRQLVNRGIIYGKIIIIVYIFVYFKNTL